MCGDAISTSTRRRGTSPSSESMSGSEAEEEVKNVAKAAGFARRDAISTSTASRGTPSTPPNEQYQ